MHFTVFRTIAPSPWHPVCPRPCQLGSGGIIIAWLYTWGNRDLRSLSRVLKLTNFRGKPQTQAPACRPHTLTSTAHHRLPSQWPQLGEGLPAFSMVFLCSPVPPSRFLVVGVVLPVGSHVSVTAKEPDTRFHARTICHLEEFSVGLEGAVGEPGEPWWGLSL